MTRELPHLKADAHLRRVEAALKNAVVVFHPDVDFTDIWVEPCTSWSGGDMIEVWAVYGGDTGDLAVPAKHSLRTRILEVRWGMGVDAFPNMHLVAEADAKDHAPEAAWPSPRTSFPPARAHRSGWTFDAP